MRDVGNWLEGFGLGQYRRSQPPKRPKLNPFTSITDSILEGDQTAQKQRHTAKRIFDRLRDEHGFAGGQTIVKDYVRERRQRLRELCPRPGGTYIVAIPCGGLARLAMLSQPLVRLPLAEQALGH